MQSRHDPELEIESPQVVPDPLAGDEMAFLWAISYSDLLMVLLTFFIIFFEFSEAATPSAMERLLADLEHKAGLKVMQGGGIVSLSDNTGTARGASHPAQSEVPTEAKQGNAARDLSSLIEHLTSTRVQVNKIGTKQDLIIHFPDDLYPMGEFSLTDQGKREVDRVLDLIMPYADQVALVFTGHTDEVPVRVFKQHVIDSNFVLSSLRSGHAVNYAVKKGFDPRWVTAQGSAEYARNTRSLSVRIMERGTR